MTQPEQPTGVRIVLSSGAEIPCDLAYDGLDPDGLHSWIAAPRVPVGLPPGEIAIRLDTLPARTTLSIALVVDAPP